MKKKPAFLGYDPNFKFTEEEREKLWRLVREKFGPKKATNLTDSMEFVCKMQSWRNKSSRDHRSVLIDMLKNFKQTEKHLDSLGGNEEDKEPKFLTIAPGPLRGIMDVTAFKGIPITSNPVSFDINIFSRKCAADILPSLKNLIKNLNYALKLQPAKTGAPKGSLVFFIRLIADAYRTELGVAPKNGGVFLKVIRQLLFILSLPYENPRRAIREALKPLKKV